MNVMLMMVLIAALQAAPASSDATAYVVGANDVLNISVFNQPQLSGKFAVEADGTLAFPLLGRVNVGGLSVRSVEQKVTEGLADGFLKEPRVSVTVEQYRSQQIFVMGEVKQPGPLQFTGSMTLIEALARAGSTTERASQEALIIRPLTAATKVAEPLDPKAANTEPIRVNLENLQTGALSQNLPLRAGDTIFIPRAETVFVSGRVRNPGEYVIRAGMTVREVLALAGGVDDRGSTRRLQIIRRQKDGRPITMSADLEKPVQAGDTIVVRERYF